MTGLNDKLLPAEGVGFGGGASRCGHACTYWPFICIASVDLTPSGLIKPDLVTGLLVVHSLGDRGVRAAWPALIMLLVWLLVLISLPM